MLADLASSRRVRLAATLALAAGLTPAHAQPCGPRWLPAETFDRFSPRAVDQEGRVAAFRFLTSTLTVPSFARVMRWSPQTRTWSDLSDDIRFTVADPIFRIATLTNGDLVIAGRFDLIGNTPITRIARFSNATKTWVPLGAISGLGFPATGGGVARLAPLPNGNLVVSGGFISAGGIPVPGIAEWDAATDSWRSIAPPGSSNFSLVTAAFNGDLYAFASIPTTSDPTSTAFGVWHRPHLSPTWINLPGPGTYFNSPVLDLAGLVDGRVVAVGGFSIFAGLNISAGAIWNPVQRQWSLLPQMPSAFSTAVIPFADSGFFVSADRQLRVYSGPNVDLDEIQTVSGDFVAPFAARPNVAAAGIGTFGLGDQGLVSVRRRLPFAFPTANTPGWVPLANAPYGGLVNDLAPLQATGLLAVGDFIFAGGNRASGIAQWNEVTSDWDSIRGLDPQFTTFSLRATRELANGDVLVGGEFQLITPTGTSRRIARYSPTTRTWSGFGTGINATVNAVTELPNGDIIAGGTFLSVTSGLAVNRVARWDNAAQQWVRMENGFNNTNAPSSVNQLITLTSGNAVAVGRFDTAGEVAAPGIALWNTAAGRWQALPPGNPSPFPSFVVPLPNGDFLSGNGGTSLARWNSASNTWSAILVPQLPNGLVQLNAAAPLPSSDVLLWSTQRVAAAAYPVRYSPATNTWSPIVPSNPFSLEAGFSIGRMAPLKNGELGVATIPSPFNSSFLPSPRFARLTLTNIPPIGQHPGPSNAALGSTATFTASAAAGYTNLTARWEIETAPASFDYAPLQPGPIPGSAATAAITQPADFGPFNPSPTTLTLTNIDAALAGRRLRAIILNDCGSSTSDPAFLTITTACAADCDLSGSLTQTDFACFLNAYRAGFPQADCDASGSLSPADFTCFLAKYRAGCP